MILTDRIQCVRYCDILSDWDQLSGGVPQGTLDGTTIFLALANDAAAMEDSNKMTHKAKRVPSSLTWTVLINGPLKIMNLNPAK